MKKEYRCIAKTKKAIRTAFVELLEERKNIETITVEELVKRADIAKSTFYYHYDDIYAVAEEFENELIEELSFVLNEVQQSNKNNCDEYIREVISFLKDKEEIYRKSIMSSDIRFFIEKLKSIISKKVFEENATLPFSQDKVERYGQIRFLTNACVDTMVDYFKGTLGMTLDEVGELIISYLNKLK